MLECYSRYVSHMTKSCIFKILNLTKSWLQPLHKLQKKHIWHWNLHSNPQSWLAGSCYSKGTFLKKQRLKQQIFERPIPSDFTIREFVTNEDLDRQKKVLFYLLILSSFLPNNKKLVLYRNVPKRNICCVKDMGFCFWN